MSYKFLLWGIAKRAELIMADKGFQQAGELVGFVDTYQGNTSYMQYRVYSPVDAAKMMGTVDYLIIANAYFAENVAQCIQLGIDLRKVVITDNVQVPGFQEMFFRLKNISEELYTGALDTQLRLVYANEFDRRDEKRVLGTGRYDGFRSYMLDYFRFRTFEFAAGEIIKDNVPGAAAELGVFRGTFSALINQVFLDRKLYLFDTFHGFDQRDQRYDDDSEIHNLKLDFSDTSVEMVLEKMIWIQNVIIRKGWFPDSAKGVNDEFCCVRLDMDLYQPTKSGLEFFYPRMIHGGYICVHDCRSRNFDGARKAVEEFCKKYSLNYMNMPDDLGTAVIPVG